MIVPLILILKWRIKSSKSCPKTKLWLSISVGDNSYKKIVFGWFCFSVRVSTELGGGRPKVAKLSVAVVILTLVLIGIICMSIIFIRKDKFPVAFTNSQEVRHAISKLANSLSLEMLLNIMWPVLSCKIFNMFFSYSCCQDYKVLFVDCNMYKVNRVQ